jgi:hypothetical protein
MLVLWWSPPACNCELYFSQTNSGTLLKPNTRRQLPLGAKSTENLQLENHKHCSMKTFHIRKKTLPFGIPITYANQSSLPMRSLSQWNSPLRCPANPLAHSSITSHPLPLLQKRKPQSHGGQRKATHQGRQHSINEAYHSRVSFSFKSVSCSHLQSHGSPPTVLSSLDLLPE